MIISKPIVFLDLETTGTEITKDKIVQIALIKIYPDGEQVKKCILLNPGRPIPAGATEVHGITDEMVANSPTFGKISKSLAEQIHDCDVGGFNSDSFDIPLLIEEFNRVGIVYPAPGTELSTIDVYSMEKKLNSHKLGETYKRYFNEELTDAHDALADTAATVKIFFAQLQKIGGEKTIQEIQAVYQGDNNRFDLAGKMYQSEGVIYWSFGKHKDKAVLETHNTDPQYTDWILRSEFSIETKNKIKKLIQDANS